MGRPAAGLNGSLYVEVGYGGPAVAVQAVNGDGTGKWIQKFTRLGLDTGDADHARVLAVGSDSTVFTTQDSPEHGLSALDGDKGTLRWHINPLGNSSGVLSPPVVAPDDTIFMIGVDDHHGALKPFDHPTLFAVQGVDGSLKWSSVIENKTWPTTPTLGADGTVLVCFIEGLIAFDGEDGSVKWMQPIGCGDFWGQLAIGSDGTIFVPNALNFSNSERTLLALNGDDGSIKWSYHPNNLDDPSDGGFLPGAAVSTDGTVYVRRSKSMHALDSANGNVLWVSTSQHFSFNSGYAPIIGPDGTVFTVDADQKLLIAFYGEGGPVTAPYSSGHALLRTTELLLV